MLSDLMRRIKGGMKLSLAGLTLFFYPGHSFAAEGALDAPAVPDRPTARTELRRALDASGGCYPTKHYHLPWTTAGNLDVLNYYECMDKIVSDAAQNRTYSDAFTIGLYFVRAVHSSIWLDVIDKHPAGKTSTTAKTLRYFGKLDFDKTIALGQQQHLTLADICEGVGYIDCQKTVLPAFAKLGWTAPSFQ